MVEREVIMNDGREKEGQIQIDADVLLRIIGDKEVQIWALRKQLEGLSKKFEALAKKVE